jgi:hypothetical protein
VAVNHSLSQCLQEVGLAVHHLRQLWWWRRRCFSSKMLGGTRPQCRFLWCRLLPNTEGNSPVSSMASTTTTGHRRGGKRAVVQTSGSAARHLSAGSDLCLTFLLDAWLSNLSI